MSLDKINDKIIKALEDKVEILEEQVNNYRFLVINLQDRISYYEAMDEMRDKTRKLIDDFKNSDE